jgi:membrane associated rhomboid family serine protease
MLEDRYYMRQRSFGSRPSATLMLLLANAVAFVVECSIYGYPPSFRQDDLLALSWAGLRHGYVWQLVTFQFMHGGFLHLLFNCIAIYFFGRELEEDLGRQRFLALYFSSGIIGGLVQGLAGALAESFPTSAWALRFAAPTVGASAGALGLIAAFAVLYPERPLTLLVFFVIPVTMRAKFLLLFSALLALFGLVFPVSNMADAAHLGGMVTGVVFIRYVLRWNWSVPSLRRSRRPAPRPLASVPAPKSLWARNQPPSSESLPPEDFLAQEVDPILDKISAQGIQSLTERERRILQTARDRMAKR